MTPHDSTLTTELHAIADADAPLSTIDITRARADGQRVLRRRRTAALGGVSAVVVAGVAAVTVFGHGQSGRRQHPPVPAVSSLQPAPPPAFSSGSDPIPVEVTFGWLPSWIRGVTYQDDGQALLAGDTNGQRVYWVSVSKTAPTLPKSGSGSQREDAPPVNGRAAYWYVNTAKAVTLADDLEWQTADGSWVDLAGDGWTALDKRAEMLRMAADVRVGSVPMALPLHIDGMPADLGGGGGNMLRPPYAHGDAAWSLELNWGTGSGYSLTNVNVYVGPKGTVIKDPSAVCKSDRGLDVCVDQTGPDVVSLRAIGDIQGLLARITLLGMDPRYWTTHVVG